MCRLVVTQVWRQVCICDTVVKTGENKCVDVTHVCEIKCIDRQY